MLAGNDGRATTENVRISLSQKKSSRRGMVTITSLIDIMTILLIFLIYNLSDEALTDFSSADLTLPSSFTSVRPAEMESMVVVGVGKSGVVVDNNPVMTTQALRESPVGTVDEIYGALSAHREGESEMVTQGFQEEASKWVKVLGDEELTFIDMLKIMRTCSEVGYEHVYLGAIPSE